MEQAPSPHKSETPGGRFAVDDQRIARRLLGCAAVAILAGALSIVVIPGGGAPSAGAAPTAVSQAVKQQGAPRGADLRGSAAPVAPTLGAQDDSFVAPPLEERDSEFKERTPGGLEVKPTLAVMPLTVRERTRVRADVDDDAQTLATLNPGQPLRVIGAVLVGRDAERQESYWLQVRLDRGGVGYVQFTQAADLAAWRQAQVIARIRRQEEAAAEAEAASGIPMEPSLPTDLFQGAPIPDEIP